MTSDTSPRPVSPLRARMIEDMTVRGFSEKTRNDYVRNVRAFAAFIGRSPDTATAEDLRLFQLHQTQIGMQPPSVNSAVSALRFFFTVTLDRPDLARRLTVVPQPRRIPAVLSVEEVTLLLRAASEPKYKAAELCRRLGDEVAVVRQLVLIANDELIAGILNRNKLTTGHGNRWTRERVTALRSHHKIPVYCPAEEGHEQWLNLSKAAAHLQISPKTLRLAAECREIDALHPLPEGPWVFSRSVLDSTAAKALVLRALVQIARSDRLRWRAALAEVGDGQAKDRRGAVQGSPLRPGSRHPVRALVSSI
jgi:hypothetical protein